MQAMPRIGDDKRETNWSIFERSIGADLRGRLAVLIGVPIVLSYIYTMSYAGELAHHLPRPVAFAFWTGLLIPKWIAMYIGTALIVRVVPSLTASIWMTAILGGGLGTLALRPASLLFVNWFAGLNQHFLPTDFKYSGTEQVFPGSLSDLISQVMQSSLSVALWVLVIVVLSRAARVSAGGPSIHEQPSADRGIVPTLHQTDLQERQPRLGFLVKFPDIAAGGILALKAEDHYVRVYTHNNEILVHYRFTQALLELSSLDGFQVHRSFWVARSAIDSVRYEQNSYNLALRSGLKVPVSRSFVASLKQRGVISNLRHTMG